MARRRISAADEEPDTLAEIADKVALVRSALKDDFAFGEEGPEHRAAHALLWQVEERLRELDADGARKPARSRPVAVA
jgi:hypothetical protein